MRVLLRFSCLVVRAAVAVQVKGNNTKQKQNWKKVYTKKQQQNSFAKKKEATQTNVRAPIAHAGMRTGFFFLSVWLAPCVYSATTQTLLLPHSSLGCWALCCCKVPHFECKKSQKNENEEERTRSS